VIMGTTGEQLGVMKLSDALRKAQSLELDLVEIAPTANPPVCKIVDFGKYRYDIAKQEKDRKSSPAAKLKEIKFRVNIDEHDYLTKIRHGEEFLDRGNKVRSGTAKNFSIAGTKCGCNCNFEDAKWRTRNLGCS